MTTSRGGRPPVGPMISLRFPADLLDRLDRHAEATGTTRSDLLRRGAELILEDTMTITDRDIRQQVTESLTEHVDSHNIDGIVRDIVGRFGLVDINSIDHDEYWEIVANNAWGELELKGGANRNV